MNIRLAPALVILSIISLVAPACSTSPTASPTATPAKAAPTSPAAKPAASPAAKSNESQAVLPKEGLATSADWKAEWDKTLAAAKKEGKVVVAGPRGDLYRNAVMTFQKAYPEIQIDYAGSSGSDFAPKVLAERAAGQFLSDVHIGGADTPIQLKGKGALDPLKPALMLPEVTDERQWLGGQEETWLDLDRQYVFQFLGYMQYGAFVNRDVVPESELSKFEQLLDPKWKGKIAAQDPRRSGAAGTYGGYLLAVKGEDWLRKLYAQEIIVLEDARLLLEGVVRGRYPVAMGVTQADFQQFSQEGLTRNIKPLDPDSETGSRLTGGSGNISLLNKAPHPNAAKVFINWVLSKEGQQAIVKGISQSSLRLDVQGPTEDAPKPNVKYVNTHKEQYSAQIERAKEVAKEMIK